VPVWAHPCYPYARMDTTEIATGWERIDIAGRPSERVSPEAFLASFDIARVPTECGCYLMEDERGHVIYVGKAKNLRARVRAYITERDSRYSVKFLMQRVARIDFLVTATEKEALLLENSLIKKHRPRYNVHLKDDKTYVSLRLDRRHDFPRLTVTRKPRKDGATYFGPYSSAQAVRETMKQLQRIFPLRLCSDATLKNRTRPCLYYQMKQCAAPCVGYITQEEHREIAEHVATVLEGRSADVEQRMRRQIKELADRLEFEKAAVWRDRLDSLRKTLERQRTVQAAGGADRDVIGIYTHGRFSEIQILFFRGGSLQGGRSVSFNRREMPIEETLSSFLLQHYSEAPSLPPEILTPMPLDDAKTLEEILSELRGAKVSVAAPLRGEKRALIDLAGRNAQSNFEKKRLAEKANADLLDQVREKLSLCKAPQRIECFDISTLQGVKPTGSMAVFEGAAPCTARYRRFSIKQVKGQDDFAMMREVLLRRFRRAIEENDLPDLVLIDGGKGQLHVATTALRDLGIANLDVISITKSRALDGGLHSPERFFAPGRKDPIVLPQHSPVVLFLARIRDEAHRLAVAYHRKRRDRATLRSPLLDVPGIGPKRAKALLTAFGSVAAIAGASLEALAATPGFDIARAKVVKDHLVHAETAPGKEKG